MDPIYDSSDLGNLLRKRRKALGYSQAQVAQLCGTGTRFISDLENGKPTIEMGKTLSVTVALGIDLLPQVRGEA